MATRDAAKPEPTKPTRAISDGVAAGRLYEWLKQSYADEAFEIARSPEQIREKHAARRAMKMNAAQPEIARKATAMLEADGILKGILDKLEK